MKNTLFRKDVVTVESLTKEDIELVFEKTTEMEKLVKEKGGDERLKGKIMAALFYEPSSRTFSSFITSMQRLGGGIIPLNGMGATSVAKGETPEDTAKVFSSYADIIVIRHNTKGMAKLFSEHATVPVINAGDGIGEHPTQALLDAYTIKNHFANYSALTIGLVGDLLNGRTVHSLSQLLLILDMAKFILISPKQLRMPPEIVTKIKTQRGMVKEAESLQDNISEMDVIYDTRVQKERFSDLAEYERLKLAYVIDKAMMAKAKKNAILMHPLPRVGEISLDIDNDSRSVYLTEQMRNGLYIRMALLDLILRK